MKTISTNYKLTTNGKKIRVSLVALFRAVGIGGEVSEAEVPGNVLDTLRVQLVRPGVTGAEVLTDDTSKPCHYYLDGSMMDVSLAGLTGGVHRLTVLAKYGTNCHALLIADLEAPANVLYLEAGDVVMPLARMAEKDTEVDGVKYYAFAYTYGNKLAWLLDEQPKHLRGTVEAYYVGNIAATFEDATKLEGARLVLNKPGELVFDNGEIIALSPVDTFGSVGGGGGQEEHVTVLLTAPDTVDWTKYHVIAEYLSQGTSEDLPLNDSGKCDFKVPTGEQYLVILPHVEGYATPQAEHFTAVGGDRNVHYAYHVDERVERITVILKNDAGLDMSSLIGMQVTLTTESGYETKAYVTDNYQAVLFVPFGENYTIHMPSNDGWHAHKATFSDTADRTERFYIVHYSPVGAGAYGVDANGIYYTEEEIENLPDKSIIKYIAYTDSELESADRGDGSTGCGFMFEIPPVPGQNIQWATQNLQFDTTLLPNLGNASSDFKGSHNTQAMIDCAIDLGISAPAATYAMDKTITIGDTVLRGFLPAGGQWQKVMSAWTQINAISVAAGRGSLPFKTGKWWSSSQLNATDAWSLGGGILFNFNSKVNRYQVLPFFDLYV